MAIGQGFHGKPSPTLGSLPAGLLPTYLDQHVSRRVRASKWKSLRLDLLEVDSMTALIHYERQRWKKSTSSRKNHFLGLCFNMFNRCACPVSLTCIHTQHLAMWRRLLAVETLPIDRWHDRTTGEDLRARSIAIEVKHETLPANRTPRLLAAPVDLLPVLAVDLLACSRRRHCSPTRDGHQPVMTGHNARRPRTGRERRDGGPLKLLTWPFGRWTIDSSLPSSTACFGGCSPNTGERKLKNRKFFVGW